MLMTDSVQFRTSKNAPLQHSREIRLGTLDHDVKGIEIIRYEAPTIFVSATTKDGKLVKDIQASVDYTEPAPHLDGKVTLKNGAHTDVYLTEQADGVYRTWSLLPDREVTVTVRADGFKYARRNVKLPEGKTEEITFVLEPK
jgi:hypothetical protein